MAKTSMARLLSWRQALRACGSGWMENWFPDDEETGEPEHREIVRAAWCNGGMILDEGSSANLRDLKRMYNRPYGLRLWAGGKPTDAEREAAPWDGEKR